MAGKVAVEKARVKLPGTAPGEYRVALALTREKHDATPFIRLGTDLPMADGWYVLGRIEVARR